MPTTITLSYLTLDTKIDTFLSQGTKEKRKCALCWISDLNFSKITGKTGKKMRSSEEVPMYKIVCRILFCQIQLHYRWKYNKQLQHGLVQSNKNSHSYFMLWQR